MRPIAWALIHFLWQGALIAALTEAALRALHEHPAEVRYRVAGLALLTMAVVPLLTLWWLADPSQPSGSAVALSLPGGPAWEPAVVALWLSGMLAVGARTAGGLLALERLRAHSIEPPPALQARFEQLAEQTGLRAALRLVSELDTPVATGVLRPVVLFPAGLLLSLSPAQVEALLLHELTHLRRLDPLANLLQGLVETVLFYHPAVWWLSRRIRHERELCCDAAVARHVDPVTYARALARVATTRVLAPAASGGSLMDRIRRLVGRPAAPARPQWRWPAVAMVTLSGLLSVATAIAETPAAPEQPAQTVAFDPPPPARAPTPPLPPSSPPLLASTVPAAAPVPEAAPVPPPPPHRAEAPTPPPPVDPPSNRKQPKVPKAPKVPKDERARGDAQISVVGDCTHVKARGTEIVVCEDGKVIVHEGRRARRRGVAAGDPDVRVVREWAEVVERDADRWEAWADAQAESWQAWADENEDHWQAIAEGWSTGRPPPTPTAPPLTPMPPLPPLPSAPFAPAAPIAPTAPEADTPE